MPGATSRLEGMKEAREALQKLSAHAQKKIGKIALKAGAARLVPRVKAKAKVSSRADDPTRGSLQQSVTDKAGRAKKGLETRSIIVEDPAAVPKELGLTRKDYPADPFMRPAIDAGREDAAQAIADAVKQEVEHGSWR